LSDFVHETDIEVRFRDTDAMGHVNNAVYLTYVEMARQAYLHAAAPDVGYDAVPFVVGRIEIDFRSPTRTGDVLRVASRTLWIGNRSFGMEAVIRQRDSGRVAAEATSILVTYDYVEHRPIPVPDWLRAALERIEGRTLPARASV